MELVGVVLKEIAITSHSLPNKYRFCNIAIDKLKSVRLRAVAIGSAALQIFKHPICFMVVFRVSDAAFVQDISTRYRYR